MPSLPTCIGHEVGGEKAELFILRLRIWFWNREVFLTELTWKQGKRQLESTKTSSHSATKPNQQTKFLKSGEKIEVGN